MTLCYVIICPWPSSCEWSRHRSRCTHNTRISFRNGRPRIHNVLTRQIVSYVINDILLCEKMITFRIFYDSTDRYLMLMCHVPYDHCGLFSLWSTDGDAEMNLWIMAYKRSHKMCVFPKTLGTESCCPYLLPILCQPWNFMLKRNLLCPW